MIQCMYPMVGATSSMQRRVNKMKETINARYMVVDSTFSHTLEGNVVFCDSLERAKEIGADLLTQDDDPCLHIYKTCSKGLELICEGFIPEPEFTWIEIG